MDITLPAHRPLAKFTRNFAIEIHRPKRASEFRRRRHPTVRASERTTASTACGRIIASVRRRPSRSLARARVSFARFMHSHHREMMIFIGIDRAVGRRAIDRDDRSIIHRRVVASRARPSRARSSVRWMDETIEKKNAPVRRAIADARTSR